MSQVFYFLIVCEYGPIRPQASVLAVRVLILFSCIFLLVKTLVLNLIFLQKYLFSFPPAKTFPLLTPSYSAVCKKNNNQNCSPIRGFCGTAFNGKRFLRVSRAQTQWMFGRPRPVRETKIYDNKLSCGKVRLPLAQLDPRSSWIS
jgi:hypothetical protein